MTRANKPAHISHEGYVVLLAFLAGLPGSVTALYLLWAGGHSLQYELTLTTVIVCAWLGFAFAVRERVVFPLQTLSNLLGALREGDYSVRGRSPKPDDALGEVMREVNTLGSTLREQRNTNESPSRKNEGAVVYSLIARICKGMRGGAPHRRLHVPRLPRATRRAGARREA